jgi:hypothetical protein
MVNSGHFAVREGGCVKLRRFKGVFIEPEANRVLRLHVFLFRKVLERLMESLG